LTHSIGLNDVCDAHQLNSGPLSALRGATPPTRNNLSHANKVRDPVMAEKLFWAVYEHLGNLSPQFVSGKAGKRFARKFKPYPVPMSSNADGPPQDLAMRARNWAKSGVESCGPGEASGWYCTQ